MARTSTRRSRPLADGRGSSMSTRLSGAVMGPGAKYPTARIGYPIWQDAAATSASNEQTDITKGRVAHWATEVAEAYGLFPRLINSCDLLVADLVSRVSWSPRKWDGITHIG